MTHPRRNMQSSEWRNKPRSSSMEPRARRYWLDVFLVVFGGVTGVAMLPILFSSSHWMQEAYDDNNPPVTMKVLRHEDIDADTLRLYFIVERHRGCEFIGLDGYTGDVEKGGIMHPALVLQREDGYRPLSYPPGETIHSPPWILRPVKGPRLLLYGRYSCDGREIRTRVVDKVLM